MAFGCSRRELFTAALSGGAWFVGCGGSSKSKPDSGDADAGDAGSGGEADGAGGSLGTGGSTTGGVSTGGAATGGSPTGGSGATGPTGDTGGTGGTGGWGNSGGTGATGDGPGPTGSTGGTGGFGGTGGSGATGWTGSTGGTGATGSTGSSGSTGSTGTTGGTGGTGWTGSTGHACSTDVIFVSSGDHTHRLLITSDEYFTGADITVLSSTSEGHSHFVHITAEDFALMQAGGQVRKRSCEGPDHEWVLDCWSFAASRPGKPVCDDDCGDGSNPDNACE